MMCVSIHLIAISYFIFSSILVTSTRTLSMSERSDSTSQYTIPAPFAAAKIGRDQSCVANIIGMAQISPKIIHAVIRGDSPKNLTLATLKRKLPDLWSEQEAMLLGEN